MSTVITYPITSQRQFDRAVLKFNAANPPEPEAVVDPVMMISASNTTLTDPDKKIYLIEGSGLKNIQVSTSMNALPNGTELQFIVMDSATMNISGASGVSIAGIGSNGDTVAPIQRITMIKFAPAAWILYSFAPYVAA